MRILFVSYFFPPFNTIGAVRTGKTARLLAELGHEVRVLTARNQPLLAELPLEVSPEHVVATPWLNVNAPVEWALGGRRRVAEQGYALAGPRRSALNRLGACYKTLLHLPDGQVGWLPFALHSGSRLIRGWRPNLIFASAMPATALLAGSLLASRHGIPWVAEMRDLWADHHANRQPRWRKNIERRLEAHALRSAKGIVTVSEPLADTLRQRHHKPTAVVFNGFDPADYPQDELVPTAPGPLRIVYTGMIYQDRMNPAPLLAALARLGSRAAEIRIEFYGRYLQQVGEAARQHGVEHLVEVRPPVPYLESLALQRRADALLLLVETHPQSRGVYTGKLFEYLGARRPILAIGPGNDVAPRLIVSRSAGVVMNEPQRIAELLGRWLAQKRAGGIPPTPVEALAGFSRQEQVARLSEFLGSVMPRTTQLAAPHFTTLRRQFRRLSSQPAARER